MTTIRVTQEVRDRLAILADAHERTLGDELGAMLDDLAWKEIEVAYRNLAADPEAMAEYVAEARAWASVDLDNLAKDAAAEYPEYNRGGQGL